MSVRNLLIGLVLISVFSCTEEDKICDCIRAGEKVNSLTEKVLKSGNINKALAIKIGKLKKHQKKVCAPFEMMGGPEMQKRMETCAE